jgi:hypothetical protein
MTDMKVTRNPTVDVQLAKEEDLRKLMGDLQAFVYQTPNGRWIFFIAEGKTFGCFV